MNSGLRRPPLGIGIDIESVDRFKNQGGSIGRLLSKAFTRREIVYCKSKANPSVHFAGTFAAKEAALKAVRHSHGAKTTIAEFEVIREKDGVPKMRYIGTDPKIRAAEIWVSISHTVGNAVAVAISVLRI